eukprot:TRINITY_DN15679_c0_g1_i1.p1 TRINITY_DN15679_c0_g1~~TRINITY_DN15679_c0_g1_i1.p1  ORF type:complete len:523 (+),score=142.18 TRINITY_DN15679_c0_g1_i1:197-1765(+)
MFDDGDKVVKISLPGENGSAGTVLKITNAEKITAQTTGNSSDGSVITARASDNDSLDSTLVGTHPKTIYDKITDADVASLKIQDVNSSEEEDTYAENDLKKSVRAMHKAAELSGLLENLTVEVLAADKEVQALNASKRGAEKKLAYAANSSIESARSTVVEIAEVAQQALKDGEALQEKSLARLRARTEQKEMSERLAFYLKDAVASAAKGLKEVALSSGVEVNMTEVAEGFAAAPDEAAAAKEKALGDAMKRLSSVKSAESNQSDESVFDSKADPSSALKFKTATKLTLPNGSSIEPGSVVVIDNPDRIFRTWNAARNESAITIIDPQSVYLGSNTSAGGNSTLSGSLVPANIVNKTTVADVSLVAGIEGPEQGSDSSLADDLKAGESSLIKAENLVTELEKAQIFLHNASLAVKKAASKKKLLVQQLQVMTKTRCQMAVKRTGLLGNDLVSQIVQNHSIGEEETHGSWELFNSIIADIVVNEASGVEKSAIQVRPKVVDAGDKVSPNVSDDGVGTRCQQS